jgi:hypothetical protein
MDEPIAGKLFWQRMKCAWRRRTVSNAVLRWHRQWTLTLGAFATPCQAPQGKPGGNTTRRTNDLLLVQPASRPQAAGRPGRRPQGTCSKSFESGLEQCHFAKTICLHFGPSRFYRSVGAAKSQSLKRPRKSISVSQKTACSLGSAFLTALDVCSKSID